MSEPAGQSNILLNVLLVETDPIVVSEIVLNLSENKECSVRVASSVQEWYDAIAEFQPFLEILSADMVQPSDINGVPKGNTDGQHTWKIVLLPEKDLDRITAYVEAGVNQCIFKDGDYCSEVVGAVEASLRKLKPATDDESEWLGMISAFQPGDTILHYRIIESIGEGGMGEVYKASDLKLGRYVAIKVLPVRVSGDAVARKRLIREARSASALNHPNIVTIHAIEEAGNSCFIVMEFVEGRSLASLIAEETFEMKQLIEVIAQAADALGAAHAIGLIHRDIKPENIMITKEGNVKLLDFGLAKRSIGASESVTNLTETGAISGTVSYMSPEQTHGQALDARTDIFSLGCVLYRASTGQLPFSGDSVLDILNAINSTDPPPPSSIHTRLPQEFDLILSRAMAKDREQRYASAYEFAEALRKMKAFVSGQSLSVRLDAPLAEPKRNSGQVSTNKLVAKRKAPAAELKPVTFTISKPPEKSHSFAILTLIILGLAAGASLIHFSRTMKKNSQPSNLAFSASSPKAEAPAVFAPETPAKNQVKTAESDNVDELTYWKSIKNSSNAKDFRDYLLRYPEGEFADLAWQKVKVLEGHAAGEEVRTAAQEQKPPNAEPAPQESGSDSFAQRSASDSGASSPPSEQRSSGRRPGPGGGQPPPPPFFPPRPGSVALTGTTWHMQLDGNDVYFHFTPESTIYIKAPFLSQTGICGNWVQNPTSITVNLCDGSKWEGERDSSQIRWNITAADGSSYNNVYSDQATSAVNWQ